MYVYIDFFIQKSKMAASLIYGFVTLFVVLDRIGHGDTCLVSLKNRTDYCSNWVKCPLEIWDFYTPICVEKTQQYNGQYFSEYICDMKCKHYNLTAYVNLCIGNKWKNNLQNKCRNPYITTVRVSTPRHNSDSGESGSFRSMVIGVTIASFIIFVLILGLSIGRRRFSNNTASRQHRSPTMIYSVTLAGAAADSLSRSISTYMRSSQRVTADDNLPTASGANDEFKPPAYEDVVKAHNGDELPSPPSYSDVIKQKAEEGP